MEFLRNEGTHTKIDQFVGDNKYVFLEYLIKEGTKIPPNFDRIKLNDLIHPNSSPPLTFENILDHSYKHPTCDHITHHNDQ